MIPGERPEGEPGERGQMEGETKYSVLMSVYIKEKAENLRTAMNSIWGQTTPTDDFVLVCDGPLTAQLDAVVEEMEKAHPEALHVVQLEKNAGLGNALNAGMKHCRHELIARMDSDDISRPDRCEKQLEVFRTDPKVSVCSGAVEEFSASPDEIEARRVPPEKQADILRFARKRNPFNHPCVMYKKSAVEDAGGYRDFYLLEDYYLWIRMLQKGCVGYNLQEPLLWMRAGSEMYKRRSGWKYVKSQKALFKHMKEIGFITGPEYFRSVIIRSASAMTPNRFREFMFKTILRKKTEGREKA